MPKKRLPATLDGSCRGEGGVYSVVEKVWKDKGGDRENMMSAEKFRRYTAEVEEIIERRELLDLKNKAESDEQLKRYTGD